MTDRACVNCTANIVAIRQLVRQAERRQRASLPVKKQLEAIQARKDDSTTCAEAGHPAMQNSNDATRARHAAAREARAGA